jgi:hypothetical protein
MAAMTNRGHFLPHFVSTEKERIGTGQLSFWSYKIKCACKALVVGSSTTQPTFATEHGTLSARPGRVIHPGCFQPDPFAIRNRPDRF